MAILQHPTSKGNKTTLPGQIFNGKLFTGGDDKSPLHVHANKFSNITIKRIFSTPF